MLELNEERSLGGSGRAILSIKVQKNDRQSRNVQRGWKQTIASGLKRIFRKKKRRVGKSGEISFPPEKSAKKKNGTDGGTGSESWGWLFWGKRCGGGETGTAEVMIQKR